MIFGYEMKNVDIYGEMCFHIRFDGLDEAVRVFCA